MRNIISEKEELYRIDTAFFYLISNKTYPKKVISDKS